MKPVDNMGTAGKMRAVDAGRSVENVKAVKNVMVVESVITSRT